MPAKQRPSFLKRQKEMARLQKQQEKGAKRQARKREKEMGVAADAAPALEGAESLEAPPVEV